MRETDGQSFWKAGGTKEKQTAVCGSWLCCIDGRYNFAASSCYAYAGELLTEKHTLPGTRKRKSLRDGRITSDKV